MKDKILLFIPMYNCEKQIVRVLGQLTEDIQEQISEVILVNNRSTDGGEDVAAKCVESHSFQVPVKVLRNKENYGLGGSHKVAFRYALEHQFDYVIVLHGDDQGHIENILPYLKAGKYREVDCLLGARFMKGSHLDGYSKFRTFGNNVYNMLFSLVTRKRIYDLGSGLNMYAVKSLSNGYYLQYKDNLMFNYCMILGAAYYKQKIEFFPIRWSEDDQVSNVKMVNQAITVLKLLGKYMIKPKKFMNEEHRDNASFSYEAEVVYSNAKEV